MTGEGVNRQRNQPCESDGATKKGLRGDSRREAVVFLSDECRPAQDFWAYPRRFRGFPLRDSHPVGAASLG